MITIQDWFATIPEEDKHIAFVGEHQSVTREFLLTGSNWKTYEDWGFHLDMAFDLSTVTSQAQRQLETTQMNTTENVSETLVKTNGTTTKEKYTVTEVDVDCADKTDIATLKKKVLSNGIQLTWTVLRQHTQLPGKLRTTLRALGPDGQVKKSDLMVFEVDPAVVAESAADIPQSEFEAMEEHMDEMLDAVLKSTQTVETALQTVIDAESTVRLAAEKAKQAATDAQNEVERVLVEWPTGNLGFDLEMGTNWLNLQEVTYNKGQLANGLVGNDSSKNLSLTGYIPVKEGDVLSYQRTDPDTGARIYGNLYAVCLFDQAKRVNVEANQYKAGEDGTLHEITIPAGVAYVRLTLHHLDTAIDPAIVPGHDLVDYEPFWLVRKLKAEGYDGPRMDQAVQAVRCAPQTFTEEQKAQARANIAALSSEDLFDVRYGLTSLNNLVSGEVLRVDGLVEEMTDLRKDIQGQTHNTAKEAVFNSVLLSSRSLHDEIAGVEQRVDELESAWGDVDAALDSILAIQQSLIGGDGV